MLHRRAAIGVMLCVSVLVSIFLIWDRARLVDSTNSIPHALSQSVVELVQLKPPSAEVECPSLDSVEFSYQVFNRGEVTLRGVKLGTACSCEVVGSPPDEILPGESATVGFRLTAPRAGRLQRKVPLLADGANEPIAVIDVALQVRFNPPALLPQPDNLSITFIQGRHTAHELTFDALEMKRDPPWLCGFELDPPEGVEILPFKVEELPEPDPTLTLRRYHVPLANQSLSGDRRKVTVTIRTREGSPPVENAPNIWIDLVDSVAIVPNPIVFRYRPGSPPAARQVRVIDRSPEPQHLDAVPIEYDHDLLIVAARQHVGSMVTFDIVPARTPESAEETKVMFYTGHDKQTRAVVVRFEPSEQR